MTVGLAEKIRELLEKKKINIKKLMAPNAEAHLTWKKLAEDYNEDIEEIKKDVLAVVGDSLAELEKLTKNRPSLNDKEFREWCIDTFEDQRDRYSAYIRKLNEHLNKVEVKVEELVKK